MIRLPLRLTLPFALLSSLAFGAQIERTTLLTQKPERYGKVEYVVIATAAFQDPYRSADVSLSFEATTPGGAKVVVPGYYERGPAGKSSVWRLRFAPEEAGVYRGQLTLRDSAGTSQAPLEFTVAPSNKRGFLRPNGFWTFRFDNGEVFRGIGSNICWEARTVDDNAFFSDLHENERFNYEYMLGELARHGGNFYRTWMCAWNLPIDWKTVIDTDRYTNDTASINRSAVNRLDELVALNEQLGLYTMLTLDHAGSYVGGQWELNSFNKKQGGPCEKPIDFFTTPQAKEKYKDRLRYIVARWGYSPSLAVWEFFNEVDNASYGQPERIPDAIITAWHKEMAEYLKAIDPQKRLVSTSISHRDIEGMNQIAALDFNQKHVYGHTDGLSGIIRDYVNREGRPYVIGEFSLEWDWKKNFNLIADGLDTDYKRGQWRGLFSPTPIAPLTWWWEFFDERKLTPYLARVRTIHDEMIAAGGGQFTEVNVPWVANAATGAEGKASVSTLAVKCGKSTFVLLSNRGAAAETGKVSITPDAGAKLGATVFDPESGSWKNLSNTANGQPVFEVTVPAGADHILILSPSR